MAYFLGQPPSPIFLGLLGWPVGLSYFNGFICGFGPFWSMVSKNHMLIELQNKIKNIRNKEKYIHVPLFFLKYFEFL